MEYKLGILISGEGTNMLNIIQACRNGEIQSKVVTVISNNPKALGLKKAKAHGVNIKVIDDKKFNNNAEYEIKLSDYLFKNKVNLICLAGFMKILSKRFTDKWNQKIINIHPSLLPAFKGLNTHKRAIDLNVKYSGCTVHFATNKVDSGKIIDQEIVKVLPTDDEFSLKKKILMKEHKLYIKVIKKMEKLNE